MSRSTSRRSRVRRTSVVMSAFRLRARLRRTTVASAEVVRRARRHFLRAGAAALGGALVEAGRPPLVEAGLQTRLQAAGAQQISSRISTIDLQGATLLQG